MFRRLFWMSTGAFLGLWGRYKVIQTIEKYVPKAVADRLDRAARRAAGDFVTASKGAREAMRERERTLRQNIQSQNFQV